jgi:hypothetical protein
MNDALISPSRVTLTMAGPPCAVGMSGANAFIWSVAQLGFVAAPQVSVDVSSLTIDVHAHGSELAWHLPILERWRGGPGQLREQAYRAARGCCL